MLSRAAAALALALALLAGCAGVANDTRFNGFFASALWTASTIGFAQAQGPVPVVILGEPFPGAPRDVFALSAAAAMSGANAGPPLVFTAAATDRGEGSFYAVLAFGTARVGALDLCRVAAPEVAPSEGRIGADAAFCVGPRRITGVRGAMLASVVGPDDPAFIEFLRALTLNLLPPPRQGGARRGCSPIFGC